MATNKIQNQTLEEEVIMDIRTVAQAKKAIEALNEQVEQLKEQIATLRESQGGSALVKRLRDAGVMPRMR